MSTTVEAPIREAVVLPVGGEWEDLVVQHRRFVESAKHARTEEFVERATRMARLQRIEVQQPVGTPELGREPRVLPELSLMPAGFRMYGPTPADPELEAWKLTKTFEVYRSKWSTAEFRPPYSLMSSDHEVTVPGYWFPVALDGANAEKGRIELGVIASKDYGEVSAMGVRWSDAQGYVGMWTPQVSQLTKTVDVVVGAQVNVDATACGWAPEKESVSAQVALTLDVTVFPPATVGPSPLHYSEQVIPYSKYFPGGGAFFDAPIPASHFLKTSFTVEQPQTSFMFVTLTAEARGTSTLGAGLEQTTVQCPLVLIDAEGYGDSDGAGRYYYRPGSVLVSGFSVATRPK